MSVRCLSMRRAAGFSMIETLVAVIVISIGLLGIAKMQGLVLSTTSSARMRSLAALEASSLAASMHANREYWASNPSQTTTVNGTTITASDTTLAGDLGAASSTSCVSTTANATSYACDNVHLAAFDLYNWVRNLNTLLPSPQASISCPAGGAPMNCTIYLYWSENLVAANTQENGLTPAQLAQPQYELYVEP